MLLYTFQDYGEVGFMSPESTDIPQTNIIGRSNSPQSVVYDPLRQVKWKKMSHQYTVEPHLSRPHLTGLL